MSLLSSMSSATGCVTYNGDGVPLTLDPCTSTSTSTSTTAQQWRWDSSAGAIRLVGSTPAVCFNIRTAPGGGAEPGAVGGYFTCNPAGAPHNEVFTFDPHGRLVSQMEGTWSGQCVTAPAPPPPAPPSTGLNVWPIPREEHASGPPLPLSHSFTIEYSGTSAVANAAASRYTAFLFNTTATTHTAAEGVPDSVQQLGKLTLLLDSADDTYTNWTVNESYGARFPTETHTRGCHWFLCRSSCMRVTSGIPLGGHFSNRLAL
jgi:hypothetical protein